MKSATSYLPPLGYLKPEEASSQPSTEAQLHVGEKSPDIVNVENVTSLDKSGIELNSIMHPFYEGRERAKVSAHVYTHQCYDVPLLLFVLSTCCILY